MPSIKVMTKVDPFVLPLAREDFAKALAKGQGRALMDARRFGGRPDLFPLIIESGLHNQAHDPQFEDDRGDWIAEIADACGMTDDLEDAVADSLVNESAEVSYWDAHQRRQIAFCLAYRGRGRAREALYASFRKEEDTLDLLGCSELIALDGAKALVYVARRLGSLLVEDPGVCLDDQPLVAFDEAYGSGQARPLLQAAAGSDQAVRRYLDYLDAEPEGVRGPYRNVANVRFQADAGDSHVRRMQAISVGEVVKEIRTEDPDQNPYWFASWGLHAALEDLEVVLEALRDEDNPGRICKYLRVFVWRPPPRLDPRMLAFAASESPKVRWCAYRALARVAAPEVRELALRRIGEGRIEEGELRLLTATYESGDHIAIQRALHVPDDRYVLRAIVGDLVCVFETHTIAEGRDAMIFVYEESPCSACRLDAVGILIEIKALPTWIREECRFDATEGIRTLVDR